jgi:hypothetical protein
MNDLQKRLPAMWLAAVLAGAAWNGPAQAVEPPSKAGADAAGLAKREEELLRQYRDLERSFLRLADLMAASDPRRSALLRNVFERAREEQVGDRLSTIVGLLEKGQFLKAGTSQQGAVEQFRGLLDLLESGDSDRQLVNTKQEVRQFLSRLAKAIARQRDIEGSTEAGGREAELAERQKGLAEETKALADDIGGFAKRIDAREGRPAAGDAGQPGKQEPGEQAREPAGSADGAPEDDGTPAAGRPQGNGEPGEPAPGGGEAAAEEEPAEDDDVSRARRTMRRLQAAEQRMQKARRQLDEARRRDARQDQQKAVEELETARAELEQILRQMREQEVERLLVQLETRVREMLKAERLVRSAAEKLAAEAAAAADRERELEAARLGREQAAIGTDAAKALLLVRDDGSAVAIPQALEAVRDDAAQAAARLSRGDVGGTTRGILADLVTSLEELLAALEKAQREQQSKQAGAAGGRPPEPGEQPLVDKLSELKMIRSLQMRVNTRTKRFSQLLDAGAERADSPELLEALDRLAERQRRVERAAHDIVTGRTED